MLQQPFALAIGMGTQGTRTYSAEQMTPYRITFNE